MPNVATLYAVLVPAVPLCTADGGIGSIGWLFEVARKRDEILKGVYGGSQIFRQSRGCLDKIDELLAVKTSGHFGRC